MLVVNAYSLGEALRAKGMYETEFKSVGRPVFCGFVALSDLRRTGAVATFSRLDWSAEAQARSNPQPMQLGGDHQRASFARPSKLLARPTALRSLSEQCGSMEKRKWLAGFADLALTIEGCRGGPRDLLIDVGDRLRRLPSSRLVARLRPRRRGQQHSGVRRRRRTSLETAPISFH